MPAMFKGQAEFFGEDPCKALVWQSRGQLNNIPPDNKAPPTRNQQLHTVKRVRLRSHSFAHHVQHIPNPRYVDTIAPCAGTLRTR